MQRVLQFDDTTHECLLIRKGEPVAVETVGGDTFHIRSIFILKTAEDVSRAEKILGICREMLAIYQADGPVCGKCAVPLTLETAEGREDGLYCDKCITAIADAAPPVQPIN